VIGNILKYRNQYNKDITISSIMKIIVNSKNLVISKNTHIHTYKYTHVLDFYSNNFSFEDSQLRAMKERKRILYIFYFVIFYLVSFTKRKSSLFVIMITLQFTSHTVET